MVGQDQAPNRSDNDSSQPGPQMIRGIYARSRGVTGSDLTMSPSDLVAVAYQKVSRWFGYDQGPKWYKKQISRGKLEAALKQNYSM